MLIAQEICNTLSDEEIVRKALKEVDYFSCLYQRYEARLLRYIQRISKVTREEAEDILQESFLKVWKGLHSFDAGLKLSSWLYRIVHNEVISSWRKNRGMTQDPLIEWRQRMTKPLENRAILTMRVKKNYGRLLPACPKNTGQFWF